MKILAIVPLKFDGTSYYRAYGIFPDLKKHFEVDGQTFEVHPYYDGGMGYTWADLLPYDILFLQRPSMDAAKRMKLIEFMKNLGKKIWIDFDDNLFDVPMENRVHDDMKPEVKAAMFQILNMADLITVSTSNLKEYYEKIGIKTIIEVVPNAWNFQLHGFADSYNDVKEVPPPQKKKIKYLWRGSETHCGDLISAGEAIVKAAAHHQDNVHWTFMGYNPWMITENLPRDWWAFMRSEDIMEYFRNLRIQHAQLMFFPLRDNALNRSKSNIAWMEATYAGMVCIAPNWPEWQKPGVINYIDDEHLGNVLNDFTLIDQAARKTSWEISADYIRENLSLTKVNMKRKELLTNLIK